MDGRSIATEILYQALGSSLGLVVRVSDYSPALNLLYRARAKAEDPALSVLEMRRSPILPEEEIWIVKKGLVSLEKNNEANQPSD